MTPRDDAPMPAGTAAPAQAPADADAERACHDLQTAQARLFQADKLASLGRLAAGVAHEINTPIGFVGSNLRAMGEYVWDLLQLVSGYESLLGAVERGDGDAVKTEAERGRTLARRLNARNLLEDLKQLTAESQEGLDRVRRIVQHLKTFSQVDQPEQTWVNVNQGIESALAIVGSELTRTADVIKELGAIPEIHGCPQQLNQAFLSLLVNAAQAMREKGTIWIRTFVRGDAVAVEVEDTGRGISPEHLNKIFDPFFTTQPVGKGMGLGLSIAYGIVRSHGGAIEVDSQPGRGARFRVVLPVGRAA